jgi:UPF0716 protein FxsA
MGVIILLIMVGVPIVEIAVFFEVGSLMGLWPTLAAIILTAIAGSALLRHQGLSTLFRACKSLERGEFPIFEVFDGLCLMLAGALLLTPGFVTDAFGLFLFVPALRALARRGLGRYLRATGRVEAWTNHPGSYPTAAEHPGGDVIDGEYQEVSPDTGHDMNKADNRNHCQPTPYAD